MPLSRSLSAPASGKVRAEVDVAGNGRMRSGLIGSATCNRRRSGHAGEGGRHARPELRPRGGHRVAIGNSRWVGLDDGRVTFTYTDYADASRTKAMALEVVEFLRRWVQHVLPRGFVKIRHYGLLANRHRAEKLTACRRLLWVSGVVPVASVPEPDVRPDPCPVCGAASWLIGERFGPLSEVRCRGRVDSS